MKGKKPLIAGAVCLLSVVPLLLILKALRPDMIAVVGIITTNTIRWVVVGSFVAVGLGTSVWGLTQLMPQALKSLSDGKLKKRSLAFRAKDSSSSDIREQLEVMMERRPKLSGVIDMCLKQMDDMASQFSRFDHLIESNEAEPVSGARVGLEEIEETLCTNFRRVINSIIAADEDASETDAFYDQYIEKIEVVVEANARALKKGNEFLLEIADNISQVDSSTLLLDAWLKTIRAQNKESLI